MSATTKQGDTENTTAERNTDRIDDQNKWCQEEVDSQ